MDCLIHVAAIYGRLDVIRCLITEYGVDPTTVKLAS